MTTHSRRPIEVFKSKRRASTASTGLEYPTCYRVDEDILSRIRSLLLSRNTHYPPRTPYASDEDRNHHSEHCCTTDTSDRFDFSTAKSVTRLLRRTGSGGIGFPIQSRSQNATFRMDGDRIPTQTSVSVPRRSLRATSSTNNLRASNDDAALHAALLPCCPPCPPEGTKKGFRLPRIPLTLKDKPPRKQRDTNFRSCIDFTPDTIPTNDISAKKPNIPCCPPYDLRVNKSKAADQPAPQEIDPPRRLSGKTVKADPADLACFLAGCGPGACKKHSRRFSQPVSPREKDSIILENQSTRKDQGRTAGSPLTKSPTSSVFSVDVFPHVAQSQEVAARAALQQSLSSTIVMNFSLSNSKHKVVPMTKPTTSAEKNSFDGSMPVELEPVRFKYPDSSFANIPESELPKPPLNESAAKKTDSLRNKQSDASLRSKTKSPSLLSAASEASSIRHPLLKPSVSAEPVDTGLPIPSVLTETATTSPGAAPADGYHGEASSTDVVLTTEIHSDDKDHSSLIGVGLEVGTAVGIVDHLTSLRKAKILASKVNDRVSSAKEWPREERAREESSATVVQHLVTTAEILEPSSQPTTNPGIATEPARKSTLKSITSLKDMLTAADPQNISDGYPNKPACCPNPTQARQKFRVDLGKPICCPVIVTQPPQYLPSIEPGDAAYWGFVPAVKEAVQEAVQTVVREAVQEIVVPPGSQQDQASSAYRKLLGDALAEVAEDADKYLRRASLWNEPPSSNRERSEVDPDFEDLIPADQEPLIGRGNVRDGLSDAGTSDQGGLGASFISPKKPPPIERKSKHSRGQAPPDDMETIPLETVDERLVENHKQGWKTLENWKGLGKRSPGYTAIPSRRSSKNRALGSRNQTTPESSMKDSLKGSRSRKRSLEKLTSNTTRALRPESSTASQRSLGSEGDIDEPVTKVSTDTKVDQSLMSNRQSASRLGHKNTVHWLRELLSSTGPYETRLTALPPRTRRDENSSTGRMRSQTAPAKPVTELYLGATPLRDQLKRIIPDTMATGDIDVEAGMPDPVIGEASRPEPINEDQQNTAMTQAFTKTIDDLEFLLNEALFIARQAAEREDSVFGPRLLGRAAASLKRGRRGVQDEVQRRKEASSLASMHESFGSFSSSDSESSEQAENNKQSELGRHSLPHLRLKAPTVGIVDSIELAQTSHHDAGWPPTGRGPTPYPPASPVEEAAIESSAELLKNPTSSTQVATTARASSGPVESITGSPVSGSIHIGDVNPFLSEKPGNERKKSVMSSQVSPTKRSRSTTGRRSRQAGSCALDDFELSWRGQDCASRPLPMPPIIPRGASLTKAGKRRATETDPEVVKANFPTESVPSKSEVREYIKAFHHPPIQQRTSSLNLRQQAEKDQAQLNAKRPTGQTFSWQNIDRNDTEPCSQIEIPDPAQPRSLAKPNSFHDRASAISKSYDGSQPSEAIHFDAGYTHRQHGGEGGGSGGRDVVELRDKPGPNLPQVTNRGGRGGSHLFNLKGRNHISLRGEHHKGFSFARTHKKPKIARDWAPARKRFVATVACISTALVGILVGIYAAEVPAIQYWIVDFHHYTILGNVFFFIGLSIPTFFFWPLPLLHGRKPYTLGAMSLAMPLLFPQALAVGQFRSPYVDYWRVGLIMPRALMGFMLGFANMNFKSTLTDLFGASLQSENPHQEIVDENDVRRHGGGLGVWLGIWTWCAMGSIGVGFLFGAIIINHANPAWGFYISIAIIAFVLLLNVICPEVRRSAFRRSVAELKHEDGVSRRLGRGEVKMHMVHTGPKWWGEEFHYGVKLNAKMLRQPGFMVLAVYVSWIYGQIILLVVLLGSLTSKYYKFTSPYVGASVMAVPIGAFLAIPFQKASLFSRSRGNAELEDDNSETLNKKVTLSSHLVRRAIFILVLPFAGLGYTLSSSGPPIPFIVPILFAALIGFLSNLAMGECHGIIMETFDTSDLQPGMTGRARNGNKVNGKRTNYSSFPRVSSGFAITQGVGYLFAALATGVGGVAERNIGQQAATGVMAAILLILSLLLLGVLYRFRDVQIIPNSKQDDMQKWKNARRTSAILRAEGIEQQEEWRPIIIGNPTHNMRRMCILEMGGMTRWSEIRLKNHLVDSNALEAKHPNLAVIRDVEHRIKEAEQEIIHHVRRSISRHSLSRNSSRRSKRSDRSYNQPADLGGHREKLHPSGNGSGKRQRGKSRIEE